MDFLNLPTKEQFDVHNTLLASIASNVGAGGITVSNWGDVQRLVRMGLHTKMFTVGDQFQTTYDGNLFTKDVIGINHDIPTDKKYKNSLTLQFHDCLDNVQFSAPQALYNAETELPAGTHIFSLNDLKFSFTTTEAVPIGGVAFAHTWDEPYIPGKITTYAADRTTVIEADIGNQTYTENNYITDAESLTESVDKLDMAVKDNADLISTNTQFTDVDNVVYSWRFIKSAEGHMQLEYMEVI